jgi:pyruvate formate lyase activating enzyme
MMAENTSLRQLLSRRTGNAAPELVQNLDHDAVRCLACGHRCRIPAGRPGVCQVRFNEAGDLRVPWGYVSGLQMDPIEKKPFFHVYPGENALSFGMLGCDLHCSYCQNWITSQALRDDEAVSNIRPCSPAELVDLVADSECRVVVSTYNEPLITAEWAVAVFERARAKGMICGFVSNGNATPEVLRYLRPFVELYKIDLKGYDDRRYRELGGVLANVLRTIEEAKALGFWVEIVTLVVPGFNDSDAELTSIADFIAGVSRDIPWHVTAFHPQYRMDSTPATSIDLLVRAHDIGRAAGLRFVYAGNRPGQVGDRESTSCPSCGTMLVERTGYHIHAVRLRDGRCPDCRATIPGVFDGSR